MGVHRGLVILKSHGLFGPDANNARIVDEHLNGSESYPSLLSLPVTYQNASIVGYFELWNHFAFYTYSVFLDKLE